MSAATVVGTVNSLKAYESGWSDKRIGYQVGLELPFGFATICLEAGTPAPQLGDEMEIRLTPVEPEVES